MPSGLISIFAFIVALTGMIFVHELGHFLAARWFKIEVEEFGFGLPPRLFTLFRWRGTAFTINALPLGGFVRPKGEMDPQVSGGLAAAKPWHRIVVLAAGPLMNLLTAVVVVAALIGMEGRPVPGPVRVAEVTPGSPAAQAGLREDDLITAVEGVTITDVEQAVLVTREHLDETIVLDVVRDGAEVQIEATPLSSRSISEGALGLALVPQTRPATVGEMITGGVVATAFQAALIVYIPVGLIRGIIDPEQARLSGLKGIFDAFSAGLRRDLATREAAASGTARANSTNWTLHLIASLSTSLGVMNLLPIPALDGGRILFALPEILFRRRVPAAFENVVNSIALLLLIALMLFVNVMDFINPAEIPIP